MSDGDWLHADLPFQLPRSTLHPPAPAARFAALARSSSASSPEPRPPPASPPRRSRSFELVLPCKGSCDCGCRHRPAARPADPPLAPPLPHPRMAARSKRSAPRPATPSPAGAEREVTSSSASGNRAAPSRVAPAEGTPGARKGSHGTRSAAVTRLEAPDAPAPAAQNPLKIVLRRASKPDHPPAASASTPSSTLSPPVIVLDSSTASSEASSRSESPAVFPSAPLPTSIPPSTSASGFPSPSVTPAPFQGSPASSTGSASARKAAARTRQDGLNRVCHHHKSQTDRPRMTCINAPHCRTVWCSSCVNKYYLACTPNAMFEPGTLFNCPVCQDACQCAGCKRKRRSSIRRGTSDALPADSVLALPAPAEPAPGGAESRRKDKVRRASIKSSEEAWGVAAQRDLVILDDGTSSSDDDEDVSRMLTGSGAVPGAATPGVVDAAPWKAHAPTGLSATAASAPVPPPTPVPPAQPAEVAVKPIRRRSSLDCAYDRTNPITFRPTLTVSASYPSAPVPAPAPAPAARGRSGASSRRAQPPPPPAAAPIHIPMVSLFSSLPPSATPMNPLPSSTVRLTAASSRPKRTKRPSTAFDDYAVDFATGSAAGLNVDRQPSSGASTPTAASSARGGRAAAAAAAAASEFAQQGRRKLARRWHSGLSSASDCGDDSSGDEYDDDLDLLMLDQAAPPRVVEEQPLPVLAGLERNLGLEGDDDGEEAGMTFGEVFALAEDSALAAAAARPARPKVKWIEGPERRRRRAAAAAAAAAASDGSTPASPATTASSAPPPETTSVAAVPKPAPLLKSRTYPGCETIRPFDPPASSTSPSKPQPVTIKSEPDEQPPPYDSHFPAGPTSRASAPAAAPAPAPAPAAEDALSRRTPADAKLAFALLDAVRAAVAPREPTPSGSASSSGASSSAAGFGPALEAALGGMTTLSSPSKSDAPILTAPPSSSGSSAHVAGLSPSARRILPADDGVSNVEILIDDISAANAEAERRRASLAAQASIDPGKAFKPQAKDHAGAQFFVSATREALYDEEEDEDARAVKREEDVEDGEGDMLMAIAGDTSAVDAFPFDMLATSGVAAGSGDDSFEIGSPVDDLWTPASAVDSARSTSTAPSTAFDDASLQDSGALPSALAGIAAEEEFVLFAASSTFAASSSAAVVAGLTPSCASPILGPLRTPSRGLGIVPSSSLAELDGMFDAMPAASGEVEMAQA
ncbi:uncharacterized protein JCM10292_005588 [Rhodotorula paludigena]|uniref:uncharacterized protein n=1 Tax=Rhodotorula paludigena TaxID=86838 RepID=UPI00316C4E62